MATPFDLRFLSSKDGLASSSGARVSPGHAAEAPSNPAFARLPNDRHPVGLLVAIALHVLLAAALLTARLDAGPPQELQVALTKIEAAPPLPPKPQQLPDAPRTPLHPAVVPVPSVIVERPDSIQVATRAAPPAVAAPAAELLVDDQLTSARDTGA